MHRKLVLIGQLAVIVIVTILSIISNPFAVAQPGCIYPVFKFYPGSTIARVRYGEVSFRFQVCPNSSPESWVATVERAGTNATGQNLGFFIESPSIAPFASGRLFKHWNGVFVSKTCLPRVGFPCKGSGQWNINFTASVKQGVKVRKISTPDRSLTLYRNP